jgi:probable HAF family extracellular repeat protein
MHVPVGRLGQGLLAAEGTGAPSKLRFFDSPNSGVGKSKVVDGITRIIWLLAIRGGGHMDARYGIKLHSLWKWAWLIGGALPLSACLGGGSDNAAPVQRATFLNLGFLPGYISSQASATSSDGTVIVGTATTAARNRQAFRWTALQGMIGLGFMPGGTFSMANAASANGDVIIGSGDTTGANPPGTSTAFRWTVDGGSQRIDGPPGSQLCSAAGVSGDGAVIVGTCLQTNNAAFRWTATTGAVALSRFCCGSFMQSTAVAISLDGSVIVGLGHPAVTGAVMWSADGSQTILGKLPGDAASAATAVSRDGSVIVGWSTDNAGTSRAFRWTQRTGLVDLGYSGDGLLGSFATSVSGSGSIIVGYGPTATGDVALIWDEDHGLRRLDAALVGDYQTQITGWKLNQATAISDDARTIAGFGTNPQGQIEAWTVKLPD